jgi:hypothetical protein
VRSGQATTIEILFLHLVAVACLVVPLAARATGSATGECARRAGVRVPAPLGARAPDVQAALRLLDLVDDIEKVLH